VYATKEKRGAREFTFGDRFGMERNDDSESLSDTQHDVTRDPQMVAHFNANARAHLVLPLTWHHFGINTGYLHARVYASPRGKRI
jgi:hypothetical protein